MTKVIVGEDCGNSPKNLFLVKLTTAFAKGDADFILSSVAEDIRWNILGDRLIEGKDDFAEALKRLKTDKLAEVTLQHVVTHGKAGAVNDTRKSKNGKSHAFCDVYEFGNTKGTIVKEITAFVVPITCKPDGARFYSTHRRAEVQTMQLVFLLIYSSEGSVPKH